MKQKTALDILKLGHNVFLTGPAGSGKTYLLNRYIDYLREKGIGVAVTASTGIAATHMDGQTIHSWSGMGISETLSELDLAKLAKKHYHQKKFKKAKVLIIDEVSMMHAHQLDLVNSICKRFKDPFLPFGGMQVVLCGDFFQLPPVAKYGKKARFVVESGAWEEMAPQICYLEEQHRQEDRQMLQILNSIRNRTCGRKTIESILSRKDKAIKNKIVPTRLYTHNIDVDAINDAELAKIREEPKIFLMRATGIDNLIRTIKKGCLAPETLTLKKGAAVMFVKNNFERGYVNGTLGKVLGFDGLGLPIVQTSSGKEITVIPEKWSLEEDGEILASVTQMPLRLAWAITIHKSQGMTLDAAEIDLGRSFEFGMGYVALSRVRTLDGIKLLGINKAALEVDPEVYEMDKALEKLSHGNAEEMDKMSELKKKSNQKEFIKKNQ
jgi:ATP-dependent exoDNAse (exonuclease V) alpha subunit